MSRAQDRPSLRERLQEESILVALGAHDGLTAKIAEAAGIEALYHGGYATAAHHYGLPDIGLVGLEDMVGSIERMASVTGLPILADADTGFGSEPGVRRTVARYEAAGAGAIQIEDQVFPKRCGHMEGKRVIPTDEMVLKVKAAVEARKDPETLIIARSDALQVTGLDDAIARVNAYAEAGADVAMIDAPPSVEALERIAREVGIPSLANMSETGRTPAVGSAELQAMGYKVVIYPSTQTWLFAKAYRELADEVVRTGSTAGMKDRFTSFDDVNALLGLDTWQETPS
ncbi:MAG: isocitrate lyase/PEP mutase family protein [Solirubrobacteraceae bacterium]|nr:isocitrate lyase/PEP mutase family protein [Solirubrobacteraceae bacterium]